MWRKSLACACLGLSACASPRAEVDSEADIAAAVGIEAAVAFRSEAGPVQVQEPEEQHLSLDLAVRRALLLDPEVQATLSRVRIALADSDQARLLPNPVLSVLFRFVEGGGKPEIVIDFSADVMAVLQRGRRTSAADHRLRAAATQAVEAALDVVVAVQDVYAKAQAWAALIPLLEARRETLDRLLAVARRRLAAGEGTQVDVDGLAMQRALVELDVDQRRWDLREARLALARLIGQPRGEAAWQLDPWREPAPSTIDEARWIDSALVRRPEVQAATWELAALGDDLALTGLANVLGLSAGVGAERGADIGWSLGPAASANLPIFDWGQAKRDRVEAQIAEKRHELTQVGRRVVEEVRVAFGRYRYALRALERLRQEVLPLQERRRKQVEKAFLAGEVDLSALLMAEQEARAALASRVELERLATASLAQLERAVGGAGVVKSIEQSER